MAKGRQGVSKKRQHAAIHLIRLHLRCIHLPLQGEGKEAAAANSLPLKDAKTMAVKKPFPPRKRQNVGETAGFPSNKRVIEMEKSPLKMRRRAQQLRREMTMQERRLWYDFLKKIPLCVYRQKVIGSYIVDFYIAAPKTVIEIDGSQHFEKRGLAYDEKRDEYLKKRGCQILRYPNNFVTTNFDGVCEDIKNHLNL